MDLKRLSDPFPECDVEWRLAQCGETNGKVWARCVCYIQARAVMDRLDEAVGPDRWQVEYRFVHGTRQMSDTAFTPECLLGVISRVGIKCGDEWVWKEDGAEPTDIEAFKGAISGAVKRTGSAWGIARYLYRLEEGFAQIVEKGTRGALYGQTKDKKSFNWLPPQLPDWALPKGNAPKPKPAPEKTADPKAKVETKLSVGTEILEIAEQIRLSKTDLHEWAMEFASPGSKSTKDMTLDQLQKFRDVLLREFREGVKE